ncbi:hypothetical protein [Rhizobium sp. SSA_523]|uniref:hypothetical protein n=1 Tax=Rhizobium sp. SSA_523 TaxID=2952477 RepID=UPI002090D2FA|nr:hypothetical protein [Rhizobium sp. SSA_523]MCO5730669.1 hypothetical protein [Rhizobium sp. SSA_523]WKC24502.1 hypothetical protein QTJ18_10625 [Rhizobium sp. SSA_523]
MRQTLIALLSVLSLCLACAGPAEAISRYNSRSMSCEAVQSTLAREGAAVLRYPGRSGATLYDRYVASNRFCTIDDVADETTIPTRDREDCPVLHCVKRPTPEDCGSFFEPSCSGFP